MYYTAPRRTRHPHLLLLPSLLLVILLAQLLLNFAQVLAAGGGTTKGGSGAAIRPGCTWDLAVSHCTEATWTYNVWPVEGGVPVGPDDPRVSLKGTIDPTAPGRDWGADAAVCQKAGGYWRYALVSNKDWTNDAGVAFKKGEQVGVGSIGSGGGEHSQVYGGREIYAPNPRSGSLTGSSGYQWSFVEQQYNKAVSDGFITKVPGVNDFSPTSSLGLFCAYPPDMAPQSEPNTFSCSSYGSYSINQGRTYAEAAVINLSYHAKTGPNNNGDWKKTSSGDNTDLVKVYARPGDTVRFRHTLCYGNQKVRGTIDGDLRGDQGFGKTRKHAPVQGQDARRQWNQRNWFNITARVGTNLDGSTNTKDDKHAFDSNSGTNKIINKSSDGFTIQELSGTTDSYGNNFPTIKTGEHIDSSSYSGGSAQFNSDDLHTSDGFGFRVYSPGPNAAARYSCAAYVYKDPNSFVSPGFQIPGFYNLSYAGNCNVANNEGITNDVGKVVSQTLEANIVKSWIGRRTTHPGGCGCSYKPGTYVSCSCSCGGASCTKNCPGGWPSLQGSWDDFRADVYPGQTGISNGFHAYYSGDEKLPKDDDQTADNYYYLDYESAISGPGSWGDEQYYSGCTYTTCQEKDSCSAGTCGTYPNEYTGPSASDSCDSVPQGNHKTGGYAYPFRTNDGKSLQPKKTAEVIIPYNYDTYVTSAINTNTIYAGQSVKSIFKYGFRQRQNSVVSNVPYATITKPTTVRVFEFTVKPDVTFNDVKDSSKTAAGFVSGDASTDANGLCSLFRGRFGSGNVPECGEIASFGDTYDKASTYGGETDLQTPEYTRTVPDNIESGSKYCVAIGIFPSDSHNKPDASDLGISDNEGAGISPSGNTWRISGASCRTINKKPNFQVWNGGTYSASGDIITSVSKKDVGVGLGTGDFKPESIFGSWDQYMVIANGKDRSFASAARLGFKKSGLDSENSSERWGGILKGNNADSQKNFCKYVNVMSIPNACTSSTSYYVDSSSSIPDTTSDLIISRLESRYGAYTSNVKDNINTITDYALPSTGAGSTLTSSFHYVYGGSNADVYLNTALDLGNPAYYTSGYTGNNTWVIYAPNSTVHIRNNICYDTNCKNANSGEYYTSLNEQTGTYSNLAQLPQSIIIAKNIVIGENVTRVDSWLVAKGNAAGNATSGPAIPNISVSSGVIDTCEGYRYGEYRTSSDQEGWKNDDYSNEDDDTGIDTGGSGSSDSNTTYKRVRDYLKDLRTIARRISSGQGLSTTQSQKWNSQTFGTYLYDSDIATLNAILNTYSTSAPLLVATSTPAARFGTNASQVNSSNAYAILNNLISQYYNTIVKHNYDTANTKQLRNNKCNHTLIVNGPVFASTMDLKRTAGAWGTANSGSAGVSSKSAINNQNINKNYANNGSITPAEIFNLRSDTYLWSYDQANRYSEAVVTYTRELAPRY